MMAASNDFEVAIKRYPIFAIGTKANIKKNIEICGDTAVIKLKSNSYVRFLQLYSKTNTTPFSDNFFDLIPNETKTVYQKIEEGKTKEDIEKDITLFSMVDIEPKGSRISDRLEMFKILASDKNYKSFFGQFFRRF